MASDNRDWYRDWWRKKTGYVERASFRVSESDRLRMRRRREWKLLFIKAFFCLVLLVGLIKAARIYLL